MFRLTVLLLAVFLWAGSVLGEQDRPATYAQWLELFDKLLQQQRDGTEPEHKPGVGYYTPGGAFANACRAKGASFETLCGRYARLPVQHPAAASQRCDGFQELAQLWFRQNLWQGVDIQWALSPLPGEAKQLSPELAQAGQVYRTATAPFARTFGEALKTGTLGFQANEASFYALLEDVLAGRGEHNAEKLAQYFDDSMVLPSIGPQMAKTRNLAMWLALVRGKRYQEAVGAAVLATDTPLEGIGDSVPQIECIQDYGGLDWEKVFLGALLERENAPDKALIGGRRYLLDLLVYRGSEKNVPSLLELCRLCTQEEGKQDYLSALEAFLEPGKTGESYGLRDNTPKPASEALQREILARYSEIVLQGTPGETFTKMANALCRLRRPETREALLVLTRSERYRREAALALTATGEKIAVPPEPGPVRFRLMMNGIPLCNTGAYAIVFHPRGAAVDENAKTDAQGVVALEPRMFHDFEAKPDGISLRSWGQTTGIVREAVEPVFCANLPVPRDKNAVTAVEIKASSLAIRLDPAGLSKRYEGKTATLFVQKMKENGKDVLVEWKFERPYAPELTLQGLQHGRYRIVLLLPGAAADEIAFTHPQKEPLFLQLKPGAGVVFKVDGPSMASLFRLDEQGKAVPVPPLPHVTFPPMAYGLPVGRYRYEFIRVEWSNPRIQTPPKQYQPIKIPFAIDQDSPDVIDLGKIDVKPAQLPPILKGTPSTL